MTLRFDPITAFLVFLAAVVMANVALDKPKPCVRRADKEVLGAICQGCHVETLGELHERRLPIGHAQLILAASDVAVTKECEE